MPPLSSFQKKCLALAIGQTFTSNSHAGVIQVNNTEGDISACTLQNALISLETETLRGNCILSSGTFAGPNIVTFSPELSNSTISLNNSLISVSSDFSVEIQGGGITVNASPSFRAFTITTGGSLTMDSVTINGGGVYIEGGSSLSLSDCSISGSQYGGVVSFYSALNIDNCTIKNNVDNVGAGLYILSGNATLNSVTVDSNEGNFGGGIHVSNGATLDITNSTISNNSAAFSGAGLDIIGSSQVNISNSTISSNTTDQLGGAIGINNGSLELVSSTVSSNTSPSSQASINLYQNESSMTNVSLINTVIANSVGGADCKAINNSTTSSDSNSIIQDGSCNTQARTIDPLLGPLQDNGGNTLTHALLENSPAINTGDDSSCPVTDQRGETRQNTLSDQCDVGSFEANGSNDDDSSLFIIPVGSNKTVIFEL